MCTWFKVANLTSFKARFVINVKVLYASSNTENDVVKVR